MDDNGKCRLLSSVYQPFVNIAPALFYELEQFFAQTKSVASPDLRSNDAQSLAVAVDLLARLADDVKASENQNAGWPLCTDRYVVCHLGDPLASSSSSLTASSIVDHSSVGDFFYSLIPSRNVLENEIGFRFALFQFDASEADFREVAFDRNNFLTLLRNCQSTTNESIVGRRSNEKKAFFRRCLVRNGKNSNVELIRWKQLLNSADRIPNVSRGDEEFSRAYSAPTTPLLDFIDDDPPSSSSSSKTMSEEEIEKDSKPNLVDDEGVREEDGRASTPLSPTIRLPKRIGEIRRDIFSDGYLSFTGGRYRADKSCPVVEIRFDADCESWLLNEKTTAEFANALAYLYSIHRRSATTDGSTIRKDYGLVLVIGLEKIGRGEEKKSDDLVLLRSLKEAIQLYMQRVPNGVEKIFFVDACADEIAALFSEMDGDKEKSETAESRIVTLTSAELTDRVGDRSEFSDAFGGVLTYDRKRWVAFRQDLERFMDLCRTVAKNCVANIQILKDVYADTKMAAFWSSAVHELEEDICRLKRQENSLDENEFAIQLTRNGDGDLRSLRESFDDLRHLRSYTEATEKVGALYTEVRKVIVKVRNGISRRMALLETFVKAKKFIERSEKLIEIINGITRSLIPYSELSDCGRTARSKLQEFESYCNETVDPTLAEASELLLERAPVDAESDALTSGQKENILSIADELQRISNAVSQDAETTRIRLRNVVSCLDFLDQAYDWALDGREMLNRLAYSKATPSRRPNDELHSLVTHLNSHPPISPAYFASKLRLASEAGDEKLVIQCKAVQERCLNTERALVNWVKLLEHHAAVDVDDDHINANEESTASSETGGSLDNGARTGVDCCVDQEIERPVQRRRPGSAMSASTSFLSQPMLEVTLTRDNVESGTASVKTDFTGIITEDLTGEVVSEISENTLRKKRVERMAAQNANSNGAVGRKSSLPTPPPPSADLLKAVDKAKVRRPFRKLMKRSNTCEDIVVNSKPTRHQSLESLPSISEESADGGVLTSRSVPSAEINAGDENEAAPVNDEADDGDSTTDAPPPFRAPIPPSNASGSSIAYGRSIPSPLPNCSPNVRMQHMVANELLLTEEAYVASLQYVIEHYLSEMHRTDLPHQLLGQRLTIFGNIEKIFEFHIGQFLPELKRNCSEANDALGAQVAKCFLKYRTKFHLYALYNKNKPKSDALMTECAGVFFRTKQLLLRDKLDLSSYLLKPVQRMGKYALMLQQLIKACPSYDQEQMETLKAAEELVTFQLRHGNDLLAMDSIQRCDMNLKEQGQLLRQDEFVVYEGRTNHKCVRRVFLFDHLVLLAKPRRLRGVNGIEREVYEAKRCIKMSDVGMTEQLGNSELKFELWFLRHTSGQRFILQASSLSVRLAWVGCINRILWNQAFSNRELRKAETCSMGGNMCVDLKTSKNRIEDRALNASLLMKVTQPRFSSSRIGHSSTCHDFNNSQSKRPHSLISVGSSTSSSNMSSNTDSSGYHLRAASVMEASRNIRTSSESGICCEFNRSSDARSSMIGDGDDDIISVGDRSKIIDIGDRNDSKTGEFENADGAVL